MTAAAVRRALGALLLVLLALITAAGPASAHTSLVSSAPADAEVLPLPPEQLVLVFSQDVADLGAEVVVTGADGAPVAATGASVDGATVTWALDAAVPAGRYTARWRVVAADGHPVEGELSYEAAGPGAPESVAPSASEPAPSDPAPATAAPATPDATAPAVGARSPVTAGGGSAVGWVAAVLAAAGAAAAVLARRRTSRAQR